MGQGANVTKDIADIVLLDNDLNKLSNVIKEGKEILFNTLRISEALLVKNVYAVIIILAALLFRLDFPFNPRGLFILSFVNATVPASIMLLESQHDVKRFNFMKKLINFILLNGVFIGVITALLLAQYSSYDFAYTQSIILSFLILVGGINALIIIQQSYSLKKMFFGSRSSITAILMIGIYLLVMYIPITSKLFMIVPLEIQDWVVLISISLAYTVSVKYVNQFLKSIYNRLVT
jgi:magnesium-transporting ATPase (P-type)